MTAARAAIPGLAAAAILIAFTVMAGLFASQQSIWVDETTQLSGLALPWGEQLRWLAGRSEIQLGVPPDRMPPLSYWAGGLWAAVFGLSESAMRWFGITASLLAAPALYLAGRMRGGMPGGLFAMAVVLLSPNTLVMAGEIRAYPLFLTLSAWSVWAFLRCLDPETGNRVGRVATLALLLVLTAYTHFFGIVLAGALFVTLLGARILARASVRPLLLAGLFGAVALAGLLPFVLAAFAIPDNAGVATTASLREAATAGLRLGYRLLMHGSHGVYAAVVLGTGLGLLGLVILSLARAGRARGGGLSRPRNGVLLLFPLLLAAMVLPVLELWIGSFSVLEVHYNLWMVPLVAVFLAGAFAHGPGRAVYRRLAQVSGGLVIAGHLAAGSVLLAHAPLYSNGPGGWLGALWADTDQPAIVHDGSGAWAQAYFPLHYLSDGSAVQLLSDADGSLSRIHPGGLDPIPDPAAYLSTLHRVMQVRVAALNSRDLARIIRGAADCDPPRPFGAAQVGVAVFCAYFAAAVASGPPRLP